MHTVEAPTPPETPVTEAPAPPVDRHCDACGVPMLGGQDWCLECGTAAPGRLGSRPGWRAVATTLGLTLVLIGGAVAASYAALSSESTREVSAAAPPDGTPVAQVPPPVPAPPAPVVAAAPVVPPVAGTAGAAALPTAPKVTPLPKVPVVTPPAIKTPSTSTTTTTPRARTTTPRRTTRPAAPAALAPLPLGADAGNAYDPYARVTEQGDAADAYDGDSETTWNVTAKADDKPMQVGYVVDLGGAKTVKAVELTTPTPGFRVEVYAADGSEVPPDILDTRWTNVGTRSKVDQGSTGSNKAGDGKERIVLRRGTADARYVLLWFTAPPAKGASVGLTQLDLLA